MEEAFESVRNLDAHRERLKDVTIAVLSAHASRDEDDEPRGEALSCRGRPILGKIRISTVEDRAEGVADVRVLLNGDRWGQLSAPMQRAVIDECLTMIEVQQKDGAPKRDDLGRPKLQQRPWDFEHYGFHDVAQRHGASSVEVHNFRVLFDEHGQTYLPHFAPDDRPVNYLAIAPKQTRTRAKAITNAGSSDTAHQRGPLASAALVASIERISLPATLLAVAKLELMKKPRKPVVKAIKDRVRDMRLLMDYIRVEKGEDQHDPAVDLDLDAAVLVTSPPGLDMDTLDRLVGGCRDATVLAWTLDDEQRQGEPRQEVIEVIEARLQDLGAAVDRAQPAKTVEAKRGPLGDKALRDLLTHVTRAETLLGVFILESEHKSPRARVLSAIQELATDFAGPLLTDLQSIAEGPKRTNLKPDMAAAVLITNNAKAPTSLLVQFAPMCCDVFVLTGVLEAEQERGEHQRSEVVDVVTARLAELGATQETEVEVAANDADDSMGDAADAEYPNMVH
jgi:hypothetical protein